MTLLKSSHFSNVCFYAKKILIIEIWQGDTSRRIDSSEINQAGAGEFIMSRSRDTKNVTTIVLRATNLGRIVSYLDGLLPTNSHDSLITWS